MSLREILEEGIKATEGNERAQQLLNDLYSTAIRDPLTNALTRRHLDEMPEGERRKKCENGVGLIMFDIDDFKKINDIHGHIVGDLVLKKLARILKRIESDSNALACRYGGEEFMILFADNNKKKIIKIAEDLRERISASTVTYRRNKVRYTVSVGLAIYPDDKMNIDDLFDSVDRLMYKAKKEGKNRVCYSS
jgi:diguanylate cyclase (GGDEF)-like protein